MRRPLPDNTQHLEVADIHASAWFQPTIPARKWPQTHALECVATGISRDSIYITLILQSLVSFMSNVVQYSVLLWYDNVSYQRKTVFNNNVTYWSSKMEAQVNARFSPQTSQELIINVYQYLKYKAQDVEDSTCQMTPSASSHVRIYSSLNTRDQVSHSYKTTSKDEDLY